VATFLGLAFGPAGKVLKDVWKTKGSDGPVKFGTLTYDDNLYATPYLLLAIRIYSTPHFRNIDKVLVYIMDGNEMDILWNLSKFKQDR
jgi:hypothetical protein